MPNFISTADSHLCESQYGIFARGRDFLDALKNVVLLAVKHKAVVLHSGDLLDTRDLKGPVADNLYELDAFCIANKVLFLVIDGNHDHSDPPWAESLSIYRQALGIKGGDLYGMHSLDNLTRTIGGVTVSGLPFMSTADFRERVKTMEPADILLWHGMVAEVMGCTGNENMVSFKDLPVNKFKVFAVGDVHAPVVMEVNGTVCISPGSTELCSKSEPFAKSVQLITLEPGGHPILKTLPVKTRQAVGYRIMNEDDIAEVIGKLQKLKDKALVFVSFNPALRDVDKRLRLAVDETKVILRCDQLEALTLPPLPRLQTADSPQEEVQEEVQGQSFETADAMMVAILDEEVLSLTQFIPVLLPDPDLQQIATQLLGDPAPGSLLNSWAESRLIQLTNQTHNAN